MKLTKLSLAQIENEAQTDPDNAYDDLSECLQKDIEKLNFGNNKSIEDVGVLLESNVSEINAQAKKLRPWYNNAMVNWNNNTVRPLKTNDIIYAVKQAKQKFVPKKAISLTIDEIFLIFDMANKVVNNKNYSAKQRRIANQLANDIEAWNSSNTPY